MARPKEFKEIILDIEDGIATLTLHRPDNMNAFTGTMMYEIIVAFDITDANDDVKAVIVTGHGDRAFCAGADLSAGAKTFDYDARAGDGEKGRTESVDIQRDTVLAAAVGAAYVFDRDDGGTPGALNSPRR